MDYLQYSKEKKIEVKKGDEVLNLVINGLPSILENTEERMKIIGRAGFKPCYKWITFNT